MYKRFKMKKRSSNRKFRKGAKSNKRNFKGRTMRGGGRT